jgi:hypothetical protein
VPTLSSEDEGESWAVVHHYPGQDFFPGRRNRNLADLNAQLTDWLENVWSSWTARQPRLRPGKRQILQYA